MTDADARALMWDAAGSVAGFLGFVAIALLVLALIGLAGRW